MRGSEPAAFLLIMATAMSLRTLLLLYVIVQMLDSTIRGPYQCWTNTKVGSFDQLRTFCRVHHLCNYSVVFYAVVFLSCSLRFLIHVCEKSIPSQTGNLRQRKEQCIATTTAFMRLASCERLEDCGCCTVVATTLFSHKCSVSQRVLILSTRLKFQ